MCGTHEISPGKCYPIQSPKYPKPYCKREKCTWEVTCTAPSSTIELSCDLFDTQHHSKCCKGDYVKVYDDSSHLDTVCGKLDPFTPIVSNSNYMKIQFGANGDRTKGAGFNCCVKCTAITTTPEPTTEPKSTASSTFKSTVSTTTVSTTTTIPPTTVDPADLPRLPCQCGVLKKPHSDQHYLYNHPWTVALLDKSNNHFCSGTIINTLHILTSASCVAGRDLKSFKVRANEHELGKHLPRAITRHPDSVLINGDLALIEINVAFSLTKYEGIIPACLPNKRKKFTGSSATHSGYDHGKCMKNDGIFSSGSSSDRLTFEPSDKAFCGEDNGGPIVSLLDGKNYLAGIALDGSGCGSSQETAKVSSYFHWIYDNSNTGRFCLR